MLSIDLLSIFPETKHDLTISVAVCHGFCEYLLQILNVYIAVKRGKGAMQIHQELLSVFGEASTPTLRTIYGDVQHIWRRTAVC